MYMPGLNSCSTIIHMMAQYPRTIIALGLSGAMSVQVSPIGPGPHMGSESILEKHETRVINETQINRYIPRISEAFEEVKDYPITKKEVEYVLDKCGDCTSMNAMDIFVEEPLLEKVKFLYFLDVLHETLDIGAAQRALID